MASHDPSEAEQKELRARALELGKSGDAGKAAGERSEASGVRRNSFASESETRIAVQERTKSPQTNGASRVPAR